MLSYKSHYNVQCVLSSKQMSMFKQLMADTIKIKVIDGAKDYNAVLEFLRLHYYREEPLTVSTEPKEQDAADEEFNMSNISHGTCLMALQGSRECEHVVGAVMAGPKWSDEADHLEEEAAKVGLTKWGQILQFLAYVERKANVYERYGVEQALHGHVLAVNTEFRGRAIGAQLVHKLMDVGRQHGFPLLTMDCTSYYSALLCDRLGMECVSTVPYNKYLDANGKQIFSPPLPHESVKTYAIRL